VAELLLLNGKPLSTISLWLLIAIITKDGFLYSISVLPKILLVLLLMKS